MSDAITAAADALLRAILKGDRERAAIPRESFQARPFVWRDPTTIPPRDALDLSGLAFDPVGTACRAELRRIGHALLAADPTQDLADFAAMISEMNPEHAERRAVILGSVWTGVGGRP